MSLWLLKTEPSTYSWDELVREKRTVWNGITNAAALKHIRSMNKADQAFLYHTGDERAIVGIVTIISDPYSDPAEDDEKLVAVDVKPKSKLRRPVSLHEIKADPAFAGWDLLRIGRLSVVPVPRKMWDRVLKIASSTQPAGGT
jgi:predicted RNA-binding protein with PUA-like domain